jgi:hypothetical protein
MEVRSGRSVLLMVIVVGTVVVAEDNKKWLLQDFMVNEMTDLVDVNSQHSICEASFSIWILRKVL